MLLASRPDTVTLLDLTVTSGDHQDTVFVSGEIDVASTPELRTAIHLLLDAGRRDIIINLDGVTFMDASAIGELIASDLRTRQAGGSFRVTQHAGCQRLLQLTGESHRLQVLRSCQVSDNRSSSTT